LPSSKCQRDPTIFNALNKQSVCGVVFPIQFSKTDALLPKSRPAGCGAVMFSRTNQAVKTYFSCIHQPLLQHMIHIIAATRALDQRRAAQTTPLLQPSKKKCSRHEETAKQARGSGSKLAQNYGQTRPRDRAQIARSTR